MVTVFDSLAGRSVGVWGAGTEGRAALAALPPGARRFVLVDDPASPGATETAAHFGATLTTPGRALADGLVDVVVRSPGISVHRPEFAAFHEAGVAVTSLLELWMPVAPADTVIGVTGTKGKSTTSQLIGDLLVRAGRSVEVVGNIGRPVTEVEGVDVVVVEVSSYQAAALSVSPAVGVLTNLDVDHLPWHGSVEQYHRDKLTLFANDGLARLVTTDSTVDAVVADGRVPREVIVTPTGEGWSLDGTSVSRGGRRVVDLAGSVLAPAHLGGNLLLACVAAEAAVGRPLDDAVVTATVEGFRLPPGRLEVVPTTDGITWVDDPLASNPFAAAASIRSHAAVPVVLILGGDDRGVDPGPLFTAIREHATVRAVVAIGPAGSVWRSALEAEMASRDARLVVIDADDVAGAVVVAARFALPGDAVLFSPGAPTTPVVGNWEHRLAAFRDAVGDLS
ncbi:MAG: UDP-N-acetylmuramoyl-L-alanine--D-glutamate ligase [Actinomycetota bacterium]